MEVPYTYQTLQPSRGIRLLRLLPSTDAAATLRGHLFEYSLEDMYTEASSYDALSYAWGDSKTSQAISIDGLKLAITTNLYAALMHLRHRHVERLLWVDQLCIDQNNEKEKEDQIKLMSQIYAGANRAIVWLGAAKDDSDCAMEELRTIGRERSTRSKEEHVVSDRVSRLLERPWFHRIWVSDIRSLSRFQPTTNRIRFFKKWASLDVFKFDVAAQSSMDTPLPWLQRC